MEQLGKVYRYNYLAEIMSDSCGSMTNKTENSRERGILFLCEKEQLPLLRLQLQS